MFDSGVGGLSVLREIRRELPGEDLLYVADSGHAPYGDKSREAIEARSVAIVEFLLSRHAKAIVVACNTATSAAVETLRGRFPVPIIAMEPAVKPAAESTKSGVIGVLATSGTLGSDKFARLHERFGAKVDILVQACPGLVELVEAGDLLGDKAQGIDRKISCSVAGATSRQHRAGMHTLPVPRPAHTRDSGASRCRHRPGRGSRARTPPAAGKCRAVIGQKPPRYRAVLDQRSTGQGAAGDFPIVEGGY